LRGGRGGFCPPKRSPGMGMRPAPRSWSRKEVPHQETAIAKSPSPSIDPRRAEGRSIGEGRQEGPRDEPPTKGSPFRRGACCSALALARLPLGTGPTHTTWKQLIRASTALAPVERARPRHADGIADRSVTRRVCPSKLRPSSICFAADACSGVENWTKALP